MINVLAWIVLGGVAGWLASLVVRGIRGTGLGVVGDILVGIIGAIIGGLVLSLLLPGMFGIANLNLRSWGVALLTAAILLFLVRAIGVSMRSTIRV
jgi:uncharacterized membrane protein YeaQ/YmgE (transglycosylase-associated protein family)